MATLIASRPARSATRVWGALATVYLVWGSTYLAIRIAVHPGSGAGLPPLLMAGVRFLLAGGLLFLVTARRPAADGPDPLGRRQWLAALVVGAALPAGGNGLVTVAEQHVGSGTAALVIATTPLWVALALAVRRTDRLGRREAAGLALGFVGVAVLVGSGRGAALSGLLLLCLAALSWALGSVYARTAPLPRRPLVGTGMEMLCAGALLLLAALARGEEYGVRLGAVPVSAWVAFGYLVLIGSLIAYTAYVWLVANVRLSLVTTYAYVNPAVAVLLGVALAGERLTARTLVATAAVILAGVVLVVTGSEPSQ